MDSGLLVWGPIGSCTALGSGDGVLGGWLLTQCLASSSWQPGSWAGARAHCGDPCPQSSCFQQPLSDPDPKEMLTLSKSGMSPTQAPLLSPLLAPLWFPLL